MPAQPSRPAQLASIVRLGTRPTELTGSYWLPGRHARSADWPTWVGQPLRTALAGRGIGTLWEHQAQAAEAAWAGQHTVIATGTASGKSLAFTLPALQALLEDPRACTLYLAPTKALTADQALSLTELELPGLRPAVYDGDTSAADRAWARDHARYLLTNPDMVHYGLLPQHQRWARFLRRLRFVIVDECHSYTGLFGSHIALVLRRLLRLAEHYGSQPVGIVASATVADPGPTAARLLGVSDIVAVTQDTSPAPARQLLLIRPGVDDEPAPVPDAVPDPETAPPTTSHPITSRRVSAATFAARTMAALVAAGARTLTFVRSRQGTEYVARQAQRTLTRIAPQLSNRVAAYRGGYLPEDRRALEKALDSAALLGVASTTALELGVDIAGLDAVVITGFPGSMASWWQQAGRAGRGGADDPEALIVFIARDDPLDAYLVAHGDHFLAAPVERSITNPDNPHVLAGHLWCAAAELPLRDHDLPRFGSTTSEVLGELVAAGHLRRRPTGWYHTELAHPAHGVDLRGSGGTVVIVEQDTGRLLGTTELAGAMAVLHPGAVYLHQGEQYLVSELDLHDHLALVVAAQVDYTTTSRSSSTVSLSEDFSWPLRAPQVRAGLGPVTVTDQVIGFQRRQTDGSLIDLVELDMPPRQLATLGLAISMSDSLLARAGVPPSSAAGALHAAEHAAIGLLPLFTGCDPRDVGGVSTVAHPDTGEPTIIIYDGLAGGAGLAAAGFGVLTRWLTCVGDAITSCPCDSGCPSCIQSPQCGSGNQPLHKAGAVALLAHLTAALGVLTC